MRILLLAPHPFFQQRGTPIAERMLLQVLAAAGHEVEVLTFPEGEDPGVPGCRVHRVRRSRLGARRPARLLAEEAGLRRRDALEGPAHDPPAALRRRPRRGGVGLHGPARQVAVRRPLRLRHGLRARPADGGPLPGARPRARSPRLLRARGPCAGAAAPSPSAARCEAQARAFDPRGLVARLEDVSLLGEEIDSNAESLDLHPPEWAGDPLVLYVGNLQVYQGIDLLLAGFARTVAAVPAAKLIVVGGTPEEIGHYRREAARLGIAASVHFAGPRPVESLGRCLRQATVLVSPRVQGTNTPMKVYSYLDSGAPAGRHPAADPYPGARRRDRSPRRARARGDGAGARAAAGR